MGQSGGWCEKKIDQAHFFHLTDQVLAQGLAEFFANKRVASFGDGRGHYKEAIDKTGKVATYDGKAFQIQYVLA